MDENGKLDNEISVISSEVQYALCKGISHGRDVRGLMRSYGQIGRKYYKDRFTSQSRKLASEGWHAE